MISIFNITARNAYSKGTVQYFYYLTIYGQGLIGKSLRKLFKLQPLYNVKLLVKRYCDFKVSFSTDLCNSYVIGKEQLINQVESLRDSGKGSIGGDEDVVNPMIDKTIDFINLL